MRVAPLFLCALALLSGCPQESTQTPGPGAPAQVREGGDLRPDKLIFGLTPYLSPDQMKAEFEPLAEYLGSVLHIPTEVQVAPNYTDLSVRLAKSEVHLAVLSPFAYVRAKRDSPGLVLLATQIADGSSAYSAYIIAKAEGGPETVEQLRGKKFGFIDRTSASGYLYPLAFLRSLSFEPDTFFGSVIFAGNHAKLIDMVLAGEVDAGATFSLAYKNADTKKLRILAKTGRIPFDAYCAGPKLDGELIRQIRSTLLKLSTRTEEGRKILGRLTNINGFVTVGDDHYDEVRRVERLVEQH